MVLQQEPFGLPWLKGWKPPQFPQMRTIGSLVDLIFILSCSRRSLYNLSWKPHEIMRFWVLCATQSWSPGLVGFGVPPVGEIQTETQQVELKERKREVTWLNYETVTFCCDSEFPSSSGIVMRPNSERMVLAGCGLFYGWVMCLNTWHEQPVFTSDYKPRILFLWWVQYYWD